MRVRPAFLLLLILAVAPPLGRHPLSGQERGSAGLNLTDQEKERFLLNAKVTKKRSISVGVTGTTQLTMSDGKLTHDAHMQCIDVSRGAYQTPTGTELNFRDSYKFNIAAYKLDRLLNLRMVPVSVERKIGRKTCAVTWWIDDVLMSERRRYQKKISPPRPTEWNDQMYQARVFNELTYNNDPNLTNFLITKDWKLHVIDFSRAFRRHKKLRTPKNLVKVDLRVYEGLKQLDEATIKQEVGHLLLPVEIKAIIARRDIILKFFDDKIARRGELATICKLPGH